jgi:hypothetical protein
MAQDLKTEREKLHRPGSATYPDISRRFMVSFPRNGMLPLDANIGRHIDIEVTIPTDDDIHISINMYIYGNDI